MIRQSFQMPVIELKEDRWFVDLFIKQIVGLSHCRIVELFKKLTAETLRRKGFLLVELLIWQIGELFKKLTAETLRRRVLLFVELLICRIVHTMIYRLCSEQVITHKKRRSNRTSVYIFGRKYMGFKPYPLPIDCTLKPMVSNCSFSKMLRPSNKKAGLSIIL